MSKIFFDTPKAWVRPRGKSSFLRGRPMRPRAALNITSSACYQSPKPEIRSPKEIRIPKREPENAQNLHLAFRFRPSEFFRISDFGVRISSIPVSYVSLESSLG